MKEEKNAEYSLQLEYPIFGNEKWKDIIEENIIKVPTPKFGDQLFRIKNKRVDGTVLYVYAIHIFYDLMDNFLEDVRPTGLNGVSALNWILDGTQYPHNFKALSDIATVSTANYIRKNPVQALISDDDNSYLNRWGGELERDNYTIKMLQSAGSDRGTTIQFGKNLLEIEEDINSTEVTTRLMLTGLNEDDTVVILPEKYIDSAYIQAYPQPKIRHYHYSDFKVDLENGITLQNVYTMLRNEAQRLYKVEKIDIPKVNYKVNFVELSKTEEYKNYAILEKVYLNDIVTTKHSKIDIDIKAQVISYSWDAINSKYLEIELGNFRDNINKSFQNLNNALNKVSEELITNKSDLQKAIDNATQLMTNALGGHVLKRNGEILIMDTENPNTATKIWRWNINGLAYSKTGINGPYGLAITMDGAIVADFITTGVLNANVIKTGSLMSHDGSVNINLDSGSFRIGGNGVISEHTGSYSKYTHTDGTYSKVSGEGFKRYFPDGTDMNYNLIFALQQMSATGKDYFTEDVPSWIFEGLKKNTINILTVPIGARNNEDNAILENWRCPVRVGTDQHNNRFAYMHSTADIVRIENGNFVKSKDNDVYGTVDIYFLV